MLLKKTFKDILNLRVNNKKTKQIKVLKFTVIQK